MKGRVISDNTFLANEMLLGFGKEETPKRCMLSVDLKKAFHTIRWDAILKTLWAMVYSLPPPQFWLKVPPLGPSRVRVVLDKVTLFHQSSSTWSWTDLADLYKKVWRRGELISSKSMVPI